MPELSEVETVRRGLSKLIVGQTITKVTVLNPRSMQATADDINDRIVGHKVVDVRRRAKMLMIDLDGGWTLLAHLKMTGQMVYRGDADWGGGHPNDSFLAQLPDRSTRIEFDLDNNNKLFFNDQRKFGWIKLIQTKAIAGLSLIQKLGPEPLTGDPTDEFINRIRHHKKSPIKATILDQTVLAGVGNIYADESLWLARIHPQTHVENLDDADLRRLLQAIQQVMTESLEAGGSTARNYVKADGSRGDYLDKFAAVYKRDGQPCKRCGAEIIKLRVAGRGTHICPNCQQLK